MSTVATLVVRVAGDMKDAEKAFAGLESAGKGLERAWGGLGTSLSSLGSTLAKSLGGAFGTLQTTAGSALSSVQTGLGKVGDALAPLTRALPDVTKHAGALGPAFASLGPVGVVLAGITGGVLALGAAAAGIVVGLVALGKSAANAGDALLVLSQQSGISVENLSKFQYVEQQTDASVDKIVGSIRKLGTNLATGSKEAGKAIEGIGLSLSAVRALKPEEAFTQIVEGLGKIPEAGKRAAAGAAIFGKGWHDVSQLAKEDLRGLMTEADTFGATISTELAVAGDRFNDTMGQLSTLFEGLKRSIGAGVLPVMQAFAELLRDQIVSAIRASGLSATNLQSTFTTLAIVVAQGVAHVAKAVGDLLTTLADPVLLAALHSLFVGLQAMATLKGETSVARAVASAALALSSFDASKFSATASTIQERLADIRQGADRLARDLPARVKEIQHQNELAAKAANEALTSTATGVAAVGKVDEALKKLVDTLSGTDVALGAKKMLDALTELGRQGGKVTAEGASQVKAALDKWFDALRSTGQKIPEEAQKIWLAMLPPPEFDNKWLNALKKLPAPTLPVPRMAADLQKGWDQIGHLIKWETFPKQAEDAFARAKWGPMLAEWSTQLVSGVTRTVADMLTGLRPFADGFKDILRGIQGFASQILNEVLVSFTKPLTDNITKAFTEIDWKKIGTQGAKQGAIAGAVVGASVGFAFGQEFGIAAGAFLGGLSGLVTGFMVGGPVGGIVGLGAGVVGGAIGAIKGQEEQAAALAHTRRELERVHGGMDQLRATADRLGVTWQTLWETDRVEDFDVALGHLNLSLAREAREVEKLGKALQETGRSGALLTDQLAADINAKIFSGAPGAKETVFAFLEQQAQAAGKGIDTFLKNTQVKTQAGATAIGGSLAALYDELLRQGARPSEAFRQLEPAIASLQAQLAAAGLQAPAVFQPLADLARLSADAIGGPLLDAMTGLGEGLTAMHNLGLLNQETFSGFSAEVLAGFKALEAMGQGGIVAVQGMRGPLQKLWELQKDFGYTVTEDEQKLLDFAEAGGVIGDKFRPAADRMVTAINALIQRLDTFLGRILGLPAAAGTAASGIESELGDINIPPIEIPYEFIPINDLPTGYGTTDGGGGSVPAMAQGGIVRSPTLALIGEKGPEAVIPLRKSMGTEQTAVIMLDSEVLTRAVLRKQGRVMQSYGIAR